MTDLTPEDFSDADSHAQHVIEDQTLEYRAAAINLARCYQALAAENAALRQRISSQASVIETERRAHVWKVNDLETTAQNEHKLYADAWAKYEAAKAESATRKAHAATALEAAKRAYKALRKVTGKSDDLKALVQLTKNLVDAMVAIDAAAADAPADSAGTTGPRSSTGQSAGPDKPEVAGSTPDGGRPAEVGHCAFDKAWIGPCGAPVTERGMCAEHAPLVCIGCKAPATLSCDYDTAFVCGYPLCANCEHDPPSEKHPFGRGHVPKVKR
jgi:hypothetical protein